MRAGHSSVLATAVGWQSSSLILYSQKTQRFTLNTRCWIKLREKHFSQGSMSKSGSVHVALSRTVLGMARDLLHGGSTQALYILQFQDLLIKAPHLYGCGELARLSVNLSYAYRSKACGKPSQGPASLRTI